MSKTFRKIPATVITGFLGAGKTTLLRHLLTQPHGRRIALVINEFGDVGVDGDMLASCGAEGCRKEDIVELANGCLCCTVADEFLPTIESLLERPEPPDHIVIETSGLALPKPLVKAFAWPEIRSRVTVDGVVAVVDAHALAQGRFCDDGEKLNAQREADPALDHENPLEEVFEDQMLCADLVVLNKADLLEAAQLTATQSDLQSKMRPSAKLLTTRFGKIAPDILLGLSAAAEDDLASRPSHHEAEGEDHDHDDFESFALDLPEISDPAGLEARLIATAAAHDILRIKGFLALPDKPMRQVVQGVGARFERYFDRAWRSDETRRSVLVVIGRKGLDRAAITAQIRPA